MRAVVLEGGGAQLFLGWRDTTLGNSCRFLLAEDGVLRCLPNDAVSSTYSDPACAQPILVWSGPDLPPAYVRGPSTETCGGYLAAVYRIGSAIPTKPEYFVNGDGACVALGGSSFGVQYSLRDTVPPEEFVAAVQRYEARGPRLATRMIVAADGARELVGMDDMAREAECWVADWLGGYCLPHAAWITDYATDASCATKAAYQGFTPGAAGMCDAPGVAISANGQLGPLALFAIDTELDAANVYQNRDACTIAPSVFGHRYFALGEPLAATTFVHVDKVLVGSGRLRVIAYAEPGGAPLTPLGFQDTERDVECVPAAFADGTLRCLATNAQRRSRLFADATCATEVVLVARDGAGDAPPTEVTDVDEQGIVTQLFDVGAPLANGGVWMTDPVFGCISTSIPPGDWDYFALGAPREPDALALVTSRTE